jgi:BirA family transcriptional regulator, biotin operon repressor / biotin---[acetyl-CoA-carboxylase] ligase
MSWTVERHPSLASTMDAARERAREGAPDGTVVVAEAMTAGRGTHGRPWHAPPGGLYLSMVLRGIEDPHLLTLALGNAVADTLEVAGVEPRLKWVNDVWVEGRKVAGILVEGEATGSRFDFLVAGIGINVNGRAADLFGPDAAHAATLEDLLGCESCIPDLESLLLQHAGSWLARVRDGHDDEIVARFRARDALAGRRVQVVQADGVVAEGVAEGVDRQGHLLLRAGGVLHTISTGTARLA